MAIRRTTRSAGLLTSLLVAGLMVTTGVDAYAQHAARPDSSTVRPDTSAAAAVRTTDAVSAFVEVTTNLDAGLVMWNEEVVGRPAERLFEIRAGSGTLVLVPREADTWMLTRPSATLDVAPGDTARVRLEVPYTYRIESQPFGASVLMETAEGPVELGTTPLLFRRDAPIRSVLLVSMEGFRVARILPDDALLNNHSVVLESLSPAEGRATASTWDVPRARRRWIDYAAGGLALASGVVAVHYKMKADNRFDVYEVTGDPALRPEIERYDTYSAIALGGMQLGVGILALRLVFN